MDEKMLNIPKHQRNANKNHNEISLHTCRMAIINKSTNVFEGVDKREASYTVGVNANLCSHYGTVQIYLKKLKMKLPYHPQFHFWAFILKNLKH